MLMRFFAPPLALALAAGLTGCFAYTNVRRDTDRQPIVHTGVGATILMPGQSAPALPETVRGVGQRGQGQIRDRCITANAAGIVSLG